MAIGFRNLGLENKDRRFLIYYNLPEKLERWKTDRPLGMKHAKRTDYDVMAHKLFFLGKGSE